MTLSLAKIEPFYWLSDSSRTEIRLLAVLLSVFSSQMQGGAWYILGAGEVSEP